MADYLYPFADPGDYEKQFSTTATDRTILDIEAASQAIRNYCRWRIYPQVTETLVLDGPGTTVLMLPTQYLADLTAVTETQRGVGQTPVSLVVGDLEWSAAGMIWKSSGQCWTSRARGVSVTATHGFETPPADLVKLTLDLAKRSAGNPAGLTSMQVGQRMESYAGAAASMLLLDEKALLDAYRRRV